MTYIRVKWKHTHPDEPVLLYSELDEERGEVRKEEVFADGRCGFASQHEAVGGSFLGTEPVPSLAEIATDPQFEPVEIWADQFEAVWARREEHPSKPAAFDFYEKVRVKSGKLRAEKVEDELGAVLGREKTGKGGWYYAVHIYRTKTTWYFEEAELSPTGEFDRRETFYAGQSVQVQVDEQGRGGLKEPNQSVGSLGLNVIDKFKFESRGGFGCSNSDYRLQQTTCCQSYGVEDDELLDLYIDPNDLTKTISLIQGCVCPFCGCKNWNMTEITALDEVPDAWKWACKEPPKSGA